MVGLVVGSTVGFGGGEGGGGGARRWQWRWRGDYGDSHGKMMVVEVVKSCLENKNNISIQISRGKQRFIMA
ncbi:unnamed protein product [Prunus armeniaca]|uniref:Uncharacterized protein n=1 Tax=Prunus armeniaca TaxID=36596 RepID=A0A6J5W2S4_PRUAR|nr:unnamed protein product [Prunus armeniaca]